MPSLTATTRRASSKCNSSVIFPSTLITPLPAFSGSANASITARARAISSGVGAKTALQASYTLPFEAINRVGRGVALRDGAAAEPFAREAVVAIAATEVGLSDALIEQRFAAFLCLGEFRL